MESLYRYYIEALEIDRETFAVGHKHMFLLKRPSVVDVIEPADTDHQQDDEPTQLMSVRETAHAGLSEHGSSGQEWRVAVVRKVSSFPPFNRIVLGRSRVCDIPVPYLPVSKIHAHLIVEDGRVAHLCDQRSANGTSLNGVRLRSGEVLPVKSGDVIGLGTVELELLDAGEFWDFLKKHG